MKKLRVSLDGKTYDVLVEVLNEAVVAKPAVTVVATGPVSPPPAPTQPASAPPTRVGASDHASEIACPLSGKIVSIDVKVGEAFREGAQLATVEAMKMNTYVFAPRDGCVTAILVNAGEGIQEGTILFKIS